MHQNSCTTMAHNSTPEKLATVFNQIFLNKVRKLKKDIPDETAVNPIERLRKCLNKRNSPVSEFDLHTINQNDLKKILKKLKGKRKCGVDQIDSFSLKLASPYIEEVILHLVNLSLSRYQED